MIVIKTEKGEIKLKKEQATQLVIELKLLLVNYKHETAGAGSWVKFVDYVLEIKK